ncbi:SpoIIIAH-like family protein [Thermospira aquatica]|uniref:SpoIIIAH-like family protein n=1 Tax=Thermospira aquatica TaxID=2828656 RepID=A0AAX3BGG7_9SPIR|nr:SpoIIIAH-like family protein [Thermospira aquatica]URA11124.1 SpoIIIAH-like family protein [Thermospira aquatica]
MKRFIHVIVAIGLLGFFACGKKETKPEPAVEPTVKEETKSAVTATKEDTSFENVMKVLREALERERRENNSATKIQTAKAYMLLIKFLQTDQEKVKKSGMTDADVSFLVEDARKKAKERLNEVIANPTAPPEAKQEATNLLKSL